MFESALTKLAKKKKKNTLNTCIRHIYYLSSNVQSFPSSFLNALSQQPLTTNRKKRIFSRAIDTHIDRSRSYDYGFWIAGIGVHISVTRFVDVVIRQLVLHILLFPPSLRGKMDGSRFCPQRWPGQVLSLRDVLPLPSYPFFSSASVLLYIIKKKPRSRSRYELQIGQCVSNARASSRGSTAGNAYLARERERRRGRRDWTVSLA